MSESTYTEEADESEGADESSNRVYNTVGPSLSRRNVLRASALAGGAALTPVGASKLGYSPLGRAEAAAPLLAIAGIAVVAAGAKMAQHYALREARNADGDTDEALHHSIYSTGGNEEEEVIRAIEEADSHIDQSLSIPRGDAKVSAITSLADGLTETDAADAARAIVNDFYSEQLKAVYNAQQSAVNQAIQLERDRYAIGETLSESAVWFIRGGFQGTWQDLRSAGSWPSGESGWEFILKDDTGTGVTSPIMKRRTLQLPNGEEIEVIELGSSMSSGTSGSYATHTYWDGNEAYTNAYGNIGVSHPTDDTQHVVIDPTRMESVVNKIDAARTQAVNEVESIVTAIYTNYTQEDAQQAAEDLIFPSDSARNLGADYLETGSDEYARSLFELMDYSGVSPDSTGSQMTLSYTPSDTSQDPATYTDANLKVADRETFRTNFSDGTLSVGDTIDTANYAGPVIVSHIENEQVHDVYADGVITVDDITDADGASVGTVSISDPTWSTTDTAEIMAQFDEMQALYDSLPSPDSGGGGGGGLFSPTTGLVGALVALGAAYLFGQDKQRPGGKW